MVLLMIVAVIAIFGVLFMGLSAGIGGIVGSPEAGIVIAVIVFIAIIAYQCSNKNPNYTPPVRPTRKTNPEISPKPATATAPQPKPKPIRDFGEYREPLPSGGELVCKLHGWSIQYLFPGPDRRYKWTLVEIRPTEIRQYKYAWYNNFKEYQELKSTIPASSQIVKHGACDMEIHVNDSFDGVCIRTWHLPISSQTELSQIIKDYDSAYTRYTEIRSILGNPESQNLLRIRLIEILKAKTSD